MNLVKYSQMPGQGYTLGNITSVFDENTLCSAIEPVAHSLTVEWDNIPGHKTKKVSSDPK
jgi:hypothetical protein